MNPAALGWSAALDSAALSAAASIAEEALACHREALILLAEGWQSETGSAVKDFMDRQCRQGAEVVDALHRMSSQVHAVPDTWAEPRSESAHDRAPAPADSTSSPPAAAHGPADPPAPPPPAPVPGQVSPWMSQVPQTWAGPTAADSAWAVPPSGGLPPPDLGGALVGLVAEIAQALGSYADAAPSLDPAPSADGPNTDLAEEGSAEPIAPESRPADTETTVPGIAPAAAPSSAPVFGATTAPVSPPAPPEPLSPVAPVSPAPPELLAAERLPGPGTAAVPSPVPDATGPAPETPAAETPAPNGQTPCEIAADELPQVGE